MSIDKQQAIYRGNRAEQILDDPLVQEVLMHLRDTTRDAVFALPIEAREQREFLCMVERARQQFVDAFTILISGGTISKMELLNEEHTKSRAEMYRRKAYAA